METRHPTTDSKARSERSHSAARPLAPEDVCVGDFVAVLHVVQELPSYYWDCDQGLLGDRGEIVRLRLWPDDGGTPLKVVSVCLPFVLVKTPCGKQQALDIRRYHLARIGRHYANQVRKAHKKARQQQARKSNKSKSRSQ
jgi:hypothetical protein